MIVVKHELVSFSLLLFATGSLIGGHLRYGSPRLRKEEQDIFPVGHLPMIIPKTERDWD